MTEEEKRYTILQKYADKVTKALSPMPEEDLPYAIACLRTLANGMENDEVKSEVAELEKMPAKTIVFVREGVWYD
jgi:hypothetical protein